MDIRFANYRFSREKQVLYRDDEIVVINGNQARLLDFFLADPDNIHGKEEIIDRVWQGKDVSEQVVFQTISQLRALFGRDAIRTFSKKGYQWQLPLLEQAPDLEPEQTPSPGKAPLAEPRMDVTTPAVPRPKREYKRHIPWILLVLILTTLFLWPKTSAPDRITRLHLLEDQSRSAAGFSFVANRALGDHPRFDLASPASHQSIRQAFAAPKLVWSRAGLEPGDWLFWGESHGSDKGTFLHFGLARDELFWQGYLFAKTDDELASVLQDRLERLEAMGVFDQPRPSLATMNKQFPDDPDVLLELAKQLIHNGQADAALAYLQRLKELEPKAHGAGPYRALADWHMGKIYKMRRQHTQARNRLDAMADELADTPLWPLSFFNIQTSAWLAYDLTDYPAVFEILERGLQLARRQADHLSLFELHILYSILAKKTGDDQKKYAHLNEAQALLLEHDLDESNLAIVYFHFALFKKDESNITAYLERILALPRTARNYWVQDDALAMLVEHHLGRDDFAAAHRLLAQSPRGAKELILQARVYEAEQNPDAAIPILKEAFDQARLAFDDSSGVQAALLLYQLSTDDPTTRAEYRAYLESNTLPAWREQHGIGENNKEWCRGENGTFH